MAILLSAAATACNRQPAEPDEQNIVEPPVQANEVAETSGVLPAIETPLNRRDILLAVANAASTFVVTGAEGNAQNSLDGRAFTFRMRFCGEESSNLRWSFDAEERVLRVEATPNLRLQPDLPRQAGAEGFWVARPWLFSAACPQAAEPAIAAPPAEGETAPQVAPQTPPGAPVVGIAEYDTGDRVRSANRDGRPYQITKKLDADVPPEALQLVLKGRLSRGPDGKVIGCAGTGNEGPPACIVAARFDEVRIEDGNGTLLAEWRQGLGA